MNSGKRATPDCSALKAALINHVFLYFVGDNKPTLDLYAGTFPPGRATSLFDAVPATIHEMGNPLNWVFFPIFFVIDDLWFYAYHRLVHTVPFLYKHVSDLVSTDTLLFVSLTRENQGTVPTISDGFK